MSETIVKWTAGMFRYKDRSGDPQFLFFQVNPATLKRSRSASMKKTEATETRSTSTKRGGSGQKYTLEVDDWKMDLDIRIDASLPFRTKDGYKLEAVPLDEVMVAVKQLESLIEPTEPNNTSENKNGHGAPTKAQPPVVEFYWGDRSWNTVVTALSISETMFTPELRPMRIEATVSLVVVETEASVEKGKTGGAAG